MTVSARFDQFLAALRLTVDQQTDGTTKHTGVRQCLDYHYYGSYYAGNGFLVGSWGKSTEIRPPRDIDIMFALPASVYNRYQTQPGNKQSQLLQEVKGVLEASYPSTKMRGDGQVVIVPFATYGVEVVPAFELQSGQYYICDTNSGGRYKTTDPKAEISQVKNSNNATNGNTRDLIRMLKRWQECCNVPLRSFLIELSAMEFLTTWQYKGRGSVYYDWMVRDFFAFLKNKSQWSGFIVPGTAEIIYLEDTGWQSKAESAYSRAVKACDYEAGNMPYSAGGEWQKIFGTDIPTG
jgi:hypothetical protein